MKHIGIWVISGLSVLYIAVILFLRGSDAWRLLTAGDLNELGDFFAGFFTPLAFGWLIYGYLLQSSELSLQRKELELTREQLGKQTELLEEQVTADYQDSIPYLTIRIMNPDEWWSGRCRCRFENKGGPAKDIKLMNLNESSTVEMELNSLARAQFFDFTVFEISSPIRYEARFGSDRSERFHQIWEFESGKCKEITEGPERLDENREGLPTNE